MDIWEKQVKIPYSTGEHIPEERKVKKALGGPILSGE